MRGEMKELCKWVMDTALKKGASDCRVRMSRNRSVEINYRDRKPDVIKEAVTRNIGLTLYMDNRYSDQSTPDLRKPELEKFIEKAVRNTKFVEEDPYRSLPDPDYYEGRKDMNLQIYDEDMTAMSPEKRHKIAKEIEEACLDEGGDKVVSVEAGINDDSWEEVVMNSQGFEGSNRATSCWTGASMTARDEGDRRPNGYHWVGCRLMEDLPPARETGKMAAKRTLDLLGAKKLPTETLPIIVENRVGSNVVWGLLSGFYGGNIQQKRSFLAGMKGKMIASNILSIQDNPFIPRGFGSRLYDWDGLPAKPIMLVNEGKLENYLIDWYYSRKLECEPTTGGTSNLVIQPGQQSVSDLMQNLGRGILITGFIGGNSNEATGDFSVGINGKLFENGEPVQSIAEMNIAGNHLTFWKKLIALGNDPWKYSNWLTPSMVFEDVVVSGV